MKGALMKDPKKLLVLQTENVQSARQMRFRSMDDVSKNKKHIIAYVAEAIKIEKAGLKVDLKKTSEFSMPLEFENRLKKDAALKKAFAALTPGRQRAYLLHFSSAKQSSTRESRINKNLPRIMDGKGLDD
jgi:uncharacterized protein YdeI (YjbR/CyaY-like superfamily)